MSPIIRVANLDDAAGVAEIYAPAVLERSTSFEISAPDARAFASRISYVLEKYPWLVCESAADILGYAYATAHRDRAAYRWSVDVSAYVRGDVHRRGVGTALYSSLFEILALQGFRNAYAGITLPNPASEGMHMRAGFKLVGVYHHVGYKFGAWHDVAWLERVIVPATKDPSEPRPFPEVRDSAEVASALARGQTLLRKI